MKMLEPRSEPAGAVLLVIDWGKRGPVSTRAAFIFFLRARDLRHRPAGAGRCLVACLVEERRHHLLHHYATTWRQYGRRAQWAALPPQGEVFLTALLQGEFSTPSLAPVFAGATYFPPGVEFAERPP